MLVALSVLALSGSVPGAEGESREEEAQEIVSIPALEVVSVAAGDRADVRIQVRIAERYHVQANPAAGKFLIPLRLELGRTEGIEPGEPVYPPGQRHRLEGAEGDLLVYEGNVVLTVPVVVDDHASPGSRTLPGKLRYQACDSRRCFPPSALDFDVVVVIRPVSPAAPGISSG